MRNSSSSIRGSGTKIARPFKSKNYTDAEARTFAVTLKSSALVAGLIAARRGGSWPERRVPHTFLRLICEHHGCDMMALLRYRFVRTVSGTPCVSVSKMTVARAGSTLTHKKAQKPITRNKLRGLVQMWGDGKTEMEMRAFVQNDFVDPNRDTTRVVTTRRYRHQPECKPSLGSVSIELAKERWRRNKGFRMGTRSPTAHTSS